MPITHFRKKGFEICCYTVASVEQTNEMLLLIIWKCIWSRILEFLCCSLMVFLFWSLTLFGDNEWMQGKIHNFIFSKNVDNFFYICSFFVAPLSTVTFPSCWFWDTIQSRPTYRCTTFWSSNLLNKLLEFSAFAMPCSQVFVLLLIQLLSGLGAISCTRFFQHQTIIPTKDLLLSYILSRTLSKTVIILESLGDIDKLLFDPLTAEYFSVSL